MLREECRGLNVVAPTGQSDAADWPQAVSKPLCQEHFVDELSELIFVRQNFIEQIESKVAQNVVLALLFSVSTEVELNGIHSIAR